jgi:hypothetical protein
VVWWNANCSAVIWRKKEKTKEKFNQNGGLRTDSKYYLFLIDEASELTHYVARWRNIIELSVRPTGHGTKNKPGAFRTQSDSANHSTATFFSFTETMTLFLKPPCLFDYLDVSFPPYSSWLNIHNRSRHIHKPGTNNLKASGHVTLSHPCYISL